MRNFNSIPRCSVSRITYSPGYYVKSIDFKTTFGQLNKKLKNQQILNHANKINFQAAVLYLG